MKRLLLSLGLAAVIGTNAASAAVHPDQFRLSAQNGSGETGTATLLQSTGNPDEIIVQVRMTGGGTEAQPIHIHKGTCEKLDPKPAFPLTTVLDGKSVSKVKGVTLAALESGTYAINVHKSTKEVASYVSCGNLKLTAMKADGAMK